jgi:hypothetical protein
MFKYLSNHNNHNNKKNPFTNMCNISTYLTTHKDIDKSRNASLPEEKTEHWEWADAGSAASHGSENSSEESTEDENGCFPGLEVLDWVERFAFVLSDQKETRKELFNRLYIINYTSNNIAEFIRSKYTKEYKNTSRN